MVSEQQLKANQVNGKLGGVKTTEGKAVSRFNALKHGVFKETISEYEEGNHSEILELLTQQFNPASLIEEILVERIATCYIKLYRLAKAETEHIKNAIHPTDINFDWSTSDGYSPKVGSKFVEGLVNIYARYESTIENRMYKALHELERVQRMRNGDNVPSPLTIDVQEMGSFCENDKSNN